MAKPTCTPCDGVDRCFCGWTYWDSDKGIVYYCGSCGRPFQPSLFDEPDNSPASLSKEAQVRMQEIAIMAAERRLNDAEAWVRRAEDELSGANSEFRSAELALWNLRNQR
jgi:hypothetical protein